MINNSRKDRREDPEYLRSAEVARMLLVSPKTVARWAKEDKIPCVRTLGGHRRFPAKAIRELAQGLGSGRAYAASDH
ncbi:MAG: helix-turn-helix domain-containing protein [Actinomycetota bacterium]